MKTGILNLFVVLCFLLKITSANAQEKINLNEIQPTFEEEESQDAEQNEEITKIKSKQMKKLKTKEIVVKLIQVHICTSKYEYYF